MFTNKGLGAGYRQQSSSLSSSKHLPVLTFSLLGRLAVPETEPTVCPRVGFSLGRIKVEAAGHVKVPSVPEKTCLWRGAIPPGRLFACLGEQMSDFRPGDNPVLPSQAEEGSR